MCGISVIVGNDAENRQQQLRKMSDILQHRGPDDSGEFYSEGVALGHRRLSILDLSEAGRNPMNSQDGRYVITYNGEVFNYKEIRTEIGNRYNFQTETDTEVVLAAYVVWGAECLQRFIGMFAFSIWDLKEKALFCARDRFGIKPFYYRELDNRLYIASEIKALLTLDQKRKPNYQTIYKYMQWGIYEDDENTFFEGIYRLNPAHALIWKNCDYKIFSYWGLDNLETNIELTEKNDKTAEILTSSILMSMRADVPLGINLSGGLDSSILISLADQELKGSTPLEGFTQDYKDQNFSERKWVSEIAQRTQRTVSYGLMEPDDFLKSHKSMMWYQDEPYAGVPVMGYIGVYQAARRRNVKVLLDGNGLDEAFSGYKQYHNIFLKSLFRNADSDFDFYLKAYAAEWGIAKEVVLNELRESTEESYKLASRDGTRTTWSWLSQGFKNDYAADFPAFKSPYKSDLKNAMYRDAIYTKIPRALRFNDRASMAFSRELRVPFLDHRLFEFSMSLSEKSIFANGRPKGILRREFQNKLPAEITDAPKRHIQTPQSTWFEKPLRNYLGDMLHSASFASRGIIDSKRAIEKFNGIEGEKIENSFYLLQALDIETWFRMYIDTDEFTQGPQEFPVFEYELAEFAEKGA